MKSGLIVSKSEKASSFFITMLKRDGYETILHADTSSAAGRLLNEREIDICVIDVPLKDSPGQELAITASENPACQVILVIKSEYADEVTDQLAPYGILTVSKPVNQNMFWTALKMTDVMAVRYEKMQQEKLKLQTKLEDLRLINRAKLTLMTYLNMTEAEAHRYIEKQAMDRRMTRRKVAEGILRTYE